MIAVAAEGRIIAEHEQWKAREMVLTEEKIFLLWTALQGYGTLFSDITRGDVRNFVNALTSRDTMWIEVWKGDEEIVGLIWLTDMYLTTDANIHCVYLDRHPAEKDGISRAVVAWLFRSYYYERISAQIPVIYHATIRLVERLGFTKEGRKRKGVLIGGKWNDLLLYGITREEVTAWDSF